jgi:hypothetical protein
MNRTIIIGDAHGCSEEVKHLLEKCKTRAEDQVIFLGDLVDRGRDSAGCVDVAMHREKVQGKPACILGNHEEKHLFYRDIEERKGRVHVNVPSHVDTREQLRAEHYEYFRRLPTYIRIPEHNAVVVHAGVFPGRTIEQQKDKHLLHIQMIRPFNFDVWGNLVVDEKSMWASKIPKDEAGYKFWVHFWDGPERVIFGHSVLNKPLVTDKFVGIDGGCCFGMELWAFILPDNELVSVKCSGPQRARHNKHSVVYPVYGDVGTY